MSQLPETAPSPALSPSPAAPTPAAGAAPSSGQAPGGCGCGCPGAAAAPRLVYALGRIGYDLISEARLDSLTQQIAAHAGLPPDRGLAFDPRRAAVYLDANPWDAPSVEWTLVADGTPVYALRPQGPFAGETYQRLREFLRQQLDEGVERASVAGTLAGKATLLMGQVVPVLVPELRGLYSWTTAALVRAVIGPPPGQGATAQDQAEYERKRIGVTNFLERVYHELRNLGVLPQERAVNFAATNAFQVGEVYAAAMRQDLELDTVKAAPSPICRPGSDCWDVEVYFFDPQRQVQTVRRVYRFTVDVSDVVPVTIGPVRSWYTR